MSWSPETRAVAIFVGGMSAIAAIIVLTSGRDGFSWFLGVLTMGSASVATYLRERRAKS